MENLGYLNQAQITAWIFLDEVDRTGIEPVTPTMSMWCSTAEPTIRAGKSYLTNFVEISVRSHLRFVRCHLHQNKYRFESR